MTAVNTAETNMISRIHAVGLQLASTLGTLIESVLDANESRRLADTLQLNKVTSHRLLTALQRRDPLATLHLIPGPEPLRRLIRTARKKGASSRVVRDAEQAIESFDNLIREELGDRSSLDAIISASLPDIRKRYETTVKQSVYRGMRQVRGFAAEATLQSFILHVGSDPARLDVLALFGQYGVCRIRPNARLKLGVWSGISATLPGQDAPRTLDGAPIAGTQGVLLDQFSSVPAAELKLNTHGEVTRYVLDWGDAVGLSSARDVVIGELRRNCMRRYRTPDDGRPKSGHVVDVEVPARTLICDFIVHDDVYPNMAPTVKVLLLGQLGIADVNDQSRELDVLDIVETVQPLGTGIENFRCDQIPNYRDLLHHATDRLGWPPERFRGYRCRVEYPIVGSQLQFAYDVPLAPAVQPPAP